MIENAQSYFILLLDMNCNIYNVNHPFSVLIRDLMSRYALFSAFDVMPGFAPMADFTRSDVKTSSYTLLDGILISKPLAFLVSNVRFIDDGDNVSDHHPVEIDMNISLTVINPKAKTAIPVINWSKLSPETIDTFQNIMTHQLDEIVIPFYSLLHGDKCCSNDSHRRQIETYFNDICNAVMLSDSFLPRSLPSIHRPYWSREISDLKQKSIDCCRNWRDNGSPRSGTLFNCKKVCSSRYKKAIRDAKRDQNRSTGASMYDNLTTHDSNSFWKVWRNHNRENDSIVTRVDGESNEGGIADAFKKHFQKVYSNHDTPAHESLRTEFYAQFSAYYDSHSDDSIGPYFLSWAEMVETVGKLKLGKSSSGMIKPEHIYHGSTKLILHLHLLFNAMHTAWNSSE